MKNRIQLLALATLALCLCGCRTNFIEETWKSPTYHDGPVRKIAIVGVDERGDVRAALENRFVREFRRQGQEALATRDLLSLPEIKADKEAAAARLRAAGAEVVLIVRLVDVATYRHDAPATAAFSNTPGLYGYENYGWYDFYSMAFAGMGVLRTSTEQNVYLDSTLFDLKSPRKLWSALSLTILIQDADRLAEADALVAKIVKAMRKDGFVR